MPYLPPSVTPSRSAKSLYQVRREETGEIEFRRRKFGGDEAMAVEIIVRTALTTQSQNGQQSKLLGTKVNCHSYAWTIDRYNPI